MYVCGSFFFVIPRRCSMQVNISMSTFLVIDYVRISRPSMQGNAAQPSSQRFQFVTASSADFPSNTHVLVNIFFSVNGIMCDFDTSFLSLFYSPHHFFHLCTMLSFLLQGELSTRMLISLFCSHCNRSNHDAFFSSLDVRYRDKPRLGNLNGMFW
jgi:hypothetical protein